MEHKGQIQIVGVALAALIFLLVMVIYGAVQSQMNVLSFSSGVQNLINLLPLVVVAAAIIGIIVVALRLSA